MVLGSWINEQLVSLRCVVHEGFIWDRSCWFAGQEGAQVVLFRDNYHIPYTYTLPLIYECRVVCMREGYNDCH